MSDNESRPEGWMASARRCGDSLLGLLQTRVELIGVELQEEKLRAINLGVWLGIALGLAMGGFLVITGALALLLWTLAGYWGLFGLAGAELAAAALLVWLLRRKLASEPAPFSTTLKEFRKDRECLQRVI
jgi:uncharacterized membrane protein YqjE